MKSFFKLGNRVRSSRESRNEQIEHERTWTYIKNLKRPIRIRYFCFVFEVLKMRFFHLNLVSLIFCACPTPKWQKAGESSSLKYATNIIGQDGNEVGEMQVKMIVKQVGYHVVTRQGANQILHKL